ncbi:MAG: DUF4097 family beta strand repeat protein [Deltaproteobacteria bacterium]|nr:DUF4097 family beta strand repeat protein [Deltaproteobacteria bacterium]
MTRTVLLVGLLAALIRPAGAESLEGDRLSRTLDVGKQPTVEVQSPAGEIRASSAEQRRVELKVVKEGGTPAARAALKVELTADARQVRLKAQCSAEGLCTGVKVLVQLRVPSDASFSAALLNGPIKVAGRLTAVSARTMNGPIEVHGVGRATLDLQSVNGGVSGSGLSGRIAVRTVNGAVRLQLVAPLKEAVGVSTVNGKVQLYVDGKASATVQAATVTGQLRSTLPLSQAEKSSRHLKGRLGAGGPNLVARTVNGAIELHPK